MKKNQKHTRLFLTIKKCSIRDFGKVLTAFELIDYANSLKLPIEVNNSIEKTTIEINKIKNDDVNLKVKITSLVKDIKDECVKLGFETEFEF